MDKGRLLHLDGARGLAAISVVIFHYFYWYDVIYGHNNFDAEWAYYGQFGVHFFFMISGFVIFMSLQHAERPLDFVVSRFSRLYPTYWVSICITFLAVLALGLPGREVEPGDAILNLLMFHEYFKVKHVDGVYWSLTIELTFYLFIFILFLTNQIKQIDRYAIAFLFIGITQNLLTEEPLRFIEKVVLLENYAVYFISGIWLYKLKFKIATLSSHLMMVLVILFLTTHGDSYAELLVFLSVATLFILTIRGSFNFLTLQPFTYLGSISFALYLIHQNIGYTIFNLMKSYGISAPISIALATITAFLLAHNLTKYVEQPSIKTIRQVYRKYLKHVEQKRLQRTDLAN